MVFALGITIATGVLIGLAPAWRLARNPLRTLVNEAGRGADTATSHRTFSTLVVTEIALAVLLTIGAGLLVRTYLNLAATNPGFDAERVLTFFMYVPGRTEVKILPPANRGVRPIFIGSYQPLADFLRGLRERLSGMAGVESVATTSSLPLDRTQYDPLTDFQVVGGNDGAANEAVRTARTRGISPELFRALKIRLLQGRALLPTDRAGGPGVAVVNQTFVRRFLPGGSPLGRRLHSTTNLWKAGEVGFQLGQRTVDDLEIVGVVDDVKYLALGDPAEPSIYLSTEQWTNRRQTIVVRTTSADPAALIPAIRTEIESMDRLLTADFSVYTPIIAASMASQRLAATLLVLFGIVALALATVGVYGLMSYSVAQRTGEIAVRSAMGASQRDVLGLVLGRGVRLAAAGVLGGVVAAIIMRQVIAGRLYGVSPLDPRVFLVAAASLFVVATVGCLLPARRAAAIDPAEVFRQES
jgi:putative ABC transport system permease protein